MKWFRVSAVILLTAVLLLAACRLPSGTGRLVYGLTLAPSSIDPHVGASSELGIPLTSVYDPLVWLSPAGEYVPGLAERWEMSTDGTVYTFVLRQDVKFHDGSAMKADAVKYSFDRVLKMNQPPSWMMSQMMDLNSTKVIDDYTKYVGRYGARGLAYIKVNDVDAGMDGLQSPILKFLPDDTVEGIMQRTGAATGDLIFFGADKASVVNEAIGALRVKLGHDLDLIAEADWLIDLGPEGGSRGGQVVAAGSPENVLERAVRPLVRRLAEVVTDDDRASAVVYLDRQVSLIEVVRNGETVHAFAPNDWHGEFEFRDADDARALMLPSKHIGDFVYYYVRVTCASGAQAWSSPVWLRG